MSAIKLCRICLRSDNIAKAIDERLLDFYDEISDIYVFANPMLTFCPLCEYKLKKFYNFKQKCLRSNYILKRKIADLEHMDLQSLMQLAPQDSVGFSMPSDRRGFFDYKYNDDPFTYLNSTPTENNHTETYKPDKITFELDTSKDEVMIDTDLIKTEVGKMLKDPIRVKEDELIENMEEDECMEIETIAEDHSNEIDNLDDDDNIEFDEEYYLSDDENPLSENMNTDDPLDTDFENEELLSDDEKISKLKNNRKTIKKVSFKADLSSIETKTIKSNETNSKKVYTIYNEMITMKQLELLQRESSDLNDLSLDELKCIEGFLSGAERKYINLRLRFEEFKSSVVDLLEQGKIDLGEVKITKEVFLEMAAKCDINGLKVFGIGIANEELFSGSNIPKVKKFLLSLHKRFNPDYETVFKIEYLKTQAEKLAEFESRKHSEEYIKATFKCEICYIPFPYKSKLEYHNIWHDLNRPHACDICPMRFRKRSSLKKHKLNCHYTVYRCKLCPVLTYYLDGMFNHYHQHKGKLYTCDICLGQYSHKSTLNNHRLYHARFSCELCARRFHSQQVLDNHMELRHASDEAGADEATLSCEQCDAVFKSDLHRRRHMRKHEDQPQFYKCNLTSCNERFSSASELQEHARSSGHVRRPTEASYKICPVCGDQVVNSSPMSLYAHHKRNHPSEPYYKLKKKESSEKKESSSKKKESSSDKKEEKNNFDRRHTYTVLCEHCGKAFNHHSVYLDHLNTHTGAKPYKCKECDARFSMRTLLYFHRERHGAPRYQCKDCGKKFKSNANLYNHRRAHIGDRKFKCTVCDKGFLHSGSLNEHIRGVHNGIRRDKRRVRKQTDKKS